MATNDRPEHPAATTESPDATVTLTYDEMYLVFSLLVARGDQLRAREEEALAPLGADTYLVPSRKVWEAIMESHREASRRRG